MERAGAALQLVGMTVVGLGLLHGVATSDLRRELAALAVGGAIFLAGSVLAKRTGAGGG